MFWNNHMKIVMKATHTCVRMGNGGMSSFTGEIQDGLYCERLWVRDVWFFTANETVVNNCKQYMKVIYTYNYIYTTVKGCKV